MAGKRYDSWEEYEAACKSYPPLPVKPSQNPANRGARIAIDSACPVCGVVEERVFDSSVDEVPSGCYVPYAGRRWDCFALWGRVLSDEERRLLEEWEENYPVGPELKITPPSSE